MHFKSMHCKLICAPFSWESQSVKCGKPTKKGGKYLNSMEENLIHINANCLSTMCTGAFVNYDAVYIDSSASAFDCERDAQD